MSTHKINIFFNIIYFILKVKIINLNHLSDDTNEYHLY